MVHVHSSTGCQQNPAGAGVADADVCAAGKVLAGGHHCATLPSRLPRLQMGHRRLPLKKTSGTIGLIVMMCAGWHCCSTSVGFVRDMHYTA
eukprot:1225010-Amphidinium_carterae.1